MVGACIGLFIADPVADATGESLLGPVTLSASAISFVAGFGVESVFQALEALITGIFNISPAPTSNSGDGQPGNRGRRRALAPRERSRRGAASKGCW